jgi:DMSO/TMAO reductase YedYZ molybdopterin-dependent catalytic subunit
VTSDRLTGSTRREFLRTSLTAAAALVPVRSGPPQGRLLATLPLTGRGAPQLPLDTLLGSGLDARQFLDLSALMPETLVTPSGRFYIRTKRPERLDLNRPWTITVRGLVRRPVELPLVEL